MKRSIRVSASILCADFTKLGEEVRKCEEIGVDSLHIDVMDGHFVPNISIGPVIIEAIRPLTKLPIKTHLMIENPGMYIDQFIEAGSDAIMIQVECYGPLKLSSQGKSQFPKEVESIDVNLIKEDIKRIKDRGKQAYIVINPGTPLCVEPLLKDIDGVLIMSVNPGFAKQQFMPGVIPKIRKLREMYNGPIAVDGGMNEKTTKDVVMAGADIIVSASYLFRSQDPQKAVQSMKVLRQP